MKSKLSVWKLLVLVVISVAAVCTFYLYKTLKSTAVGQESVVYVPTGATYSTLIDSLETSGGKVRNIGRFNAASRLLNLDDNVRPGRYVLREGMSYMDVVRMFQRGFQSPMRITFNNIRTLDQLAGRIAAQIDKDSTTLARHFTSDTVAAHYGFKPESFIAMFIPDTYEIYWNVTPAAFTDRMKREYDKFWTDERTTRQEALGISKTDVVTLASIVYEETKMADEMPTVAGVYINRLKIGMPLQADPTVKFAVGDFTLRRILNRHLEVDSPYNTYKYAGLPPGPIAMPSVRAIDAVLDYRHHKYIYFCARPDFSGYHNFAVTHAEHIRNRNAYTAALDALGIRR